MRDKQIEKIEKKAYSPALAAQATGLHVNTVRELIRTGKLRAIKLQRKYLISVVDLQNFLSGNKPPTGGSNI
jgi:excisionase family DNA binding protein